MFGTGTWGTAFGMVLTDAGTETVLCGRRADVVDSINEPASQSLGTKRVLSCPTHFVATLDPAEALAGADLVVLAIPAQTLRANLAVWAPLFPADALLVSLIKGVELGTTKRMSEVISEVADVPAERVAVVTRSEPREGDCRAAAGRIGRCVHRRRECGAPATGVPDRLLQALHEHRRRGLRAGRAR